MGLFGSKSKTYVGTVVQRVIEDENLPDSPKTGAIKGILQNGEIVDYILDEVLGSIGPKSDRMHKYAQDNYPYGVPRKTFEKKDKGQAEVKNILEAIHGQPIEVEYSVFGPPNLIHIAWMKLISSYGYDPTTNVIGSLNAPNKTYLDFIRIVLPRSTADEYETGALEQWGNSSAAGYKPWEPFNQDLPSVKPYPLIMLWQGLADEYLDINWGYQDSSVYPSITMRGSFSIDTSGIEDTANYFHVKYKVGNQVHYWMYKEGEGSYPTLDNIFDDAANLGNFYPNIYFRYNKQSTAVDTTTDAYKASKKMCKYLGLGYDDIAEMIDANPDIGDVEQAMLTFGIPANTTNQMERRYLFHFFDEMYSAVGEIPPSTSPYGSFGSMDNMPVSNAVIIKDALFKMALNSSGLQKYSKPGIIAAIGDYNSGFGVQDINVTREYEDGTLYQTTVPLDYHFYQRQISDHLYEEVKVFNLKMVYYVLGDYTTTGDDESEILLVPLDKSIVDTMSIPDKEILLSRALHFVFNSVSVVKVKWYQTGIFKAFMIIAAIVITIFTYGSSWQALAAGLSAGGVVALAAIQTILMGILESVIGAYVFKLFVKELGAEFALLVAIVAIAYAGFSNLAEGSNLWADNLLKVGNGLMKGVSSYYGDQIEGLQQEYLEFVSLADQLDKQLKDASDALLSSANLSPYVVFGEKPNDFYNRTIHSGNIGAQSIAVVSNYYDIALQLPKFDQTV